MMNEILKYRDTVTIKPQSLPANGCNKNENIDHIIIIFKMAIKNQQSNNRINVFIV